MSLALGQGLEPCVSKFYGCHSSVELPVIGQFDAEVRSGERAVRARFVVVRGQAERLLSCKTAEALGLVSFANSVRAISETEAEAPSVLKRPPVGSERQHDRVVSSLKAAFPNAFSGKLGCIRGQEVRFDIDESVPPVRQKLRHIAFHLRDAVSAELDEQ